MISVNQRLATMWSRVGPRFLPFADSASVELPLGRLLRLSLFQVSIGMALVLLNGTLNRVMIVELGVAASVVTMMVALPVLLAPLRLMLGYRSDYHRSYLGWRRVPYIWVGTMLQFGGLAIMPFALIVLSGDASGPAFVGPLSAALAFLLVGAGLHATQTAGLALASDLAPPEKRPRVVALLYVMLLVGSFLASLAYAWMLSSFSQIRLIQVIQGAAALTFVLNMISLWKQEPRRPAETRHDVVAPPFRETWRELRADRRCMRILVTVALGTAGFSMQDILLEPFGGEVLGLTVAGTTLLNALMAAGTLTGFAICARQLERSADPLLLAAMGLLVGIAALSAIVFSSPLGSIGLLRVGALLIGLGTGLFSVGTLTAVMMLVRDQLGGKILGAWGTVTAIAAGTAIACSGLVRDGVSLLADGNALGPAMSGPAGGYMVVFHLELAMMFGGLVAIGPLVRRRSAHAPSSRPAPVGLAEFPT